MPRKKFRPKKNLFCFSLFIAFFCLIFFFPLCRPCLAVSVDTDSLESLDTPFEALGELDRLQSMADLLALAEARLKQGRWQEAAVYAKGLLSMEPENTKAHAILGTIYALTGQKEAAQKELALLKKAEYKGFSLELIEAILTAQEGKFKEAEKYLRLALQKQPGHPVALYYSGSLHLAQEKLTEAEKFFKAVLVLEPDFSPALAYLGQVYLRQKKMEEAANYYQKAVTIEPENLIYRRQLLDIYKETGQKEAANRQIKEMLYYTPGVKQANLTRGMQLLSEGFYQEAISLMDKSIGAYRSIPEAYYIRAAARINLKQNKAALKDIQSFLSERLHSPQAHQYAGMCYVALDQLDLAEEKFKKAVFLDSGMGRSILSLAVVEQLKGRLDQALKGLKDTGEKGESSLLIHYLTAHLLLAKKDKAGYVKEMEKVAELIPGLNQEIDYVLPSSRQIKDFAGERNLMVLYFLNGWYGKAAQSSENLIKINKKDPFAWYYQALSHLAQKKAEGAMHAFNQLILIDPDLIAAHMGLGRLYRNANDSQKAIKAFQKVIKINPEYSSAYVALGDIFVQIKDEEQAISSYVKAIEMNPQLVEVYQKIALMYAEKPQKLDEAMKFAAQAEKLAPEDPIALDTLGWVHVQRGEIKEAIEKLKKASEDLLRDPLIQYHLGVAYYKNNNLKEAEKLLQAAILSSKDFKGVEHAREILKKISQNP